MKLATALLVLLLAAPSAAQSACSPQDVSTVAMLPLGIQYKLLAHKIPTDYFELDAPADVRRDVVMLRKTLDIATQTFFRCEAGDDTNPASLQAKLSGFLHTDRSKRDDSAAEGGAYGANLHVHIEPAQGFPNSVFVVLTFDIECGNDNLLLLYGKEDAHWKQRLHWYGETYTKPSDAFGDVFFYTATAGPNKAEPLLAVLHGHPWCTSVHSGFSLDLIEPASSTAPQSVLDHLTHSYVRDFDSHVRRTPDGVQYHLYVEGMDANAVYHPGVLQYRTSSAKLLLLPVALNARDFLDEWLQEPWSTAESWSEPTAIASLRRRHDQFDYSLHKDGGQVPSVTFEAVRGCKSAPDHFQVEMGLDDMNRSIYAQVRQNPGSFIMLAITDRPDPTCTGPDLTRKPVEH